MAALGVSLGISLFSGALCGFLASLLPHPSHIFDDHEHFDKVNYGDDLDKYNPDPLAVPDTARTEFMDPTVHTESKNPTEKEDSDI